MLFPGLLFSGRPDLGNPTKKRTYSTGTVIFVGQKQNFPSFVVGARWLLILRIYKSIRRTNLRFIFSELGLPPPRRWNMEVVHRGSLVLDALVHKARSIKNKQNAMAMDSAF